MNCLATTKEQAEKLAASMRAINNMPIAYVLCRPLAMGGSPLVIRETFDACLQHLGEKHWEEFVIHFKRAGMEITDDHRYTIHPTTMYLGEALDPADVSPKPKR